MYLKEPSIEKGKTVQVCDLDDIESGLAESEIRVTEKSLSVSKSELKTGTQKECRILKLNKQSTAKWEKKKDNSKAEFSKAKNAILISTKDDDSDDETYEPEQKTSALEAMYPDIEHQGTSGNQ